jgi:flagellar biogenesis protein FliO
MDTVQGNVGSRPAAAARQIFEALTRLLRNVKIRRKEHSLRLRETLPLGERRMLAVVQWEGERYLLAATQNSVSVLDHKDCTQRASEFPCEFSLSPEENAE